MPPLRPVDDNNNNSNNNNNNNDDAEIWASFQTFFQGWLIRQQHYLDQLLSSSRDGDDKPEDELNALVSQVLSHYQQYYEAKSILIRQDVYILFSPPWFSSYERVFLWIAGFKPGLAFKLLNNSVKNLSEEQLERVCRLTRETRHAEKELNDEMAMVEESVALQPVVDMARITTIPQSRVTNDGEDVEAGLKTLRQVMEGVVAGADFVRMTTARKVVEILSPAQAVRFLAAATQLQLKIRARGSHIDVEQRRRTTTTNTTTTRRT